MRHLVAADWSRIWSRRLVLRGMATLGTVMVVIGVVVFVRSAEALVLVDDLLPSTRGLAAVAAIIACLLGVSIGGSDWSSGTIRLLLVWEPRRERLLASRMLTGGLFAAILCVGGLALFAVLLTVVAETRGSGGLDGMVWWPVMRIWAKGAVLAAWACVLGVGLSFVSRGTTPALLVALGYGVLVDGLAAAVLDAFARWSIRFNVLAFLEIDQLVKVVTRRPDGGAHTRYELAEVDPLRSGAVLAAYGLVVCLVGFMEFRRRDI